MYHDTGHNSLYDIMRYLSTNIIEDEPFNIAELIKLVQSSLERNSYAKVIKYSSHVVRLYIACVKAWSILAYCYYIVYEKRSKSTFKRTRQLCSTHALFVFPIWDFIILVS